MPDSFLCVRAHVKPQPRHDSVTKREQRDVRHIRNMTTGENLPPSIWPSPPIASQHTLGHVGCPACRLLRDQVIESGSQKNVPFRDASELWLRRKRQSVSERTGWDYETYLRPLLAFFGEMRLKQVHIGHIVEYRAQRLVTAGPDRINHECNTLQQILTSAGLWAPIARHYKPMKRPRGSGAGRRIGEEELRHLLSVASRRIKWRIAYLCTLVEVNTGCGPSEVLHLRLGDIDYQNREVRFVEGTKTAFRVRNLPMTEDCMWAVRQLEDIAREKGARLPEHYLVLGRAKSRGGEADPAHPATSFKRAWYSLRQEASKTYPVLAGVRRYDMRHTSLSMMAENPNVDAATFEKVAGWGPGSRMLAQRYHHEIRRRKEVCVSAVDGFRPAPHVAKPAASVTLEDALPATKIVQ